MLARQGRGSFESDVFSFGVLAFQLLTGRMPYESAPILKLLQGAPLPRIEAFSDALPDLPAPLRQVLDAALAIAPEDRPTAADIARALGANTPDAQGVAPLRSLAALQRW